MLKKSLRGLLTIGCIALVAFASAKLALVGAKKGPRLEANNLVKDFGAVTPGARLKGSFKFRNTGDAPLTIERITTSCGCTDATVSDHTVYPGKSASLEVVLNAPRVRRRIDETVVITTDDPTRRNVPVFLQANVVLPIDFSPGIINFGVVRNDDLPLVQDVEIIPGDTGIQLNDYSWSIQQSDDSISQVALELVTKNKNGKGGLFIQANLGAKAIPGPITGGARLIGKQIADNDVVTADIPYAGKVLGTIGAVPDSILIDLQNATRATNTVSIQIVRGNSTYASELSPALEGFVDVKIQGARLDVCLTPRVETLNKVSKAKRIVGVIWVHDINANARMLAIPVILLGR